MGNIYFQTMEKIKADCFNIKKIGLQLTGLVTTVTMGGMTANKMEMLNSLNDEMTSTTNSIVAEAQKLAKALEDSHFKIKSIRKDLQATSKSCFQASTEKQRLQQELDQLKNSFTKVEEELNTSKRSLAEMLGDDAEFEPLASSTQEEPTQDKPGSTQEEPNHDEPGAKKMKIDDIQG